MRMRSDPDPAGAIRPPGAVVVLAMMIGPPRGVGRAVARRTTGGSDARALGLAVERRAATGIWICAAAEGRAGGHGRRSPAVIVRRGGARAVVVGSRVGRERRAGAPRGAPRGARKRMLLVLLLPIDVRARRRAVFGGSRARARARGRRGRARRRSGLGSGLGLGVGRSRRLLSRRRSARSSSSSSSDEYAAGSDSGALWRAGSPSAPGPASGAVAASAPRPGEGSGDGTGDAPSRRMSSASSAAAEGPGADAEPPAAPIAASNAAPVFRTRGEEGGQGARRDRARGRYLSASAPARRVRRTVPTAARRRARGARRWRERATGARARVPVPPRRVRGESGRCHLERSAGKIARARAARRIC